MTCRTPHGAQKFRASDPGSSILRGSMSLKEQLEDMNLFMENAVDDDKPFFVWWNSTRMHVITHLKPESEGKTGLGVGFCEQ